MLFLYIILNIGIIFLFLKRLFLIKLKEYQGFTTRFFNNGELVVSTNSIVFWIFLTPILSIVSYLVAITFFRNYIDYTALWKITPTFWIIEFIWVFLLNRLHLVNISYIFLIALSSTIVNFYISRLLFTGDFKDIFPESSNTIWQIYTLIFLFFISLIKIVYEQEDYKKKREKYILRKIKQYQKSFSMIENLDINMRCLVFAILVKEDFERPPFYRFFEKITHSKTRNIAQNDSQNDWHSVYILIRDIVIEFSELEFDYNITNLKKVIKQINNSDDYCKDVYNLYTNIESYLNYASKEIKDII